MPKRGYMAPLFLNYAPRFAGFNRLSETYQQAAHGGGSSWGLQPRGCELRFRSWVGIPHDANGQPVAVSLYNAVRTAPVLWLRFSKLLQGSPTSLRSFQRAHLDRQIDARHHQRTTQVRWHRGSKRT